jgi:hypothetical protein
MDAHTDPARRSMKHAKRTEGDNFEIVNGIEGLRMLAEADLAQACSLDFTVWQDAMKELFQFYDGRCEDLKQAVKDDHAYIATLERQLEAAEKVVENTKKLIADVHGLGAFKRAVIAEISQTNWNVIQHWADETDYAVENYTATKTQGET